jgi:hypothetical protein
VNYTVELSCARSKGVIDTVEFAAFGLLNGRCLSFGANSSCSSANATSIVQSMCVGRQSCSVPATTALFGNPCPSNAADYRLAVQVICNPPLNSTYWNFTHFDPPVVDFLEATRGGDPVMEFCTSPSWLWDQGSGPVHHYPDNPLQTDWGSHRQRTVTRCHPPCAASQTHRRLSPCAALPVARYNTGSTLLDPTCQQIGLWFGRLAAWYTSGGFYDEYGHFHASPHHYQLGMWEVLNEMERNLHISTYTCIYDAVVKYVRLYADPKHQVSLTSPSPSPGLTVSLDADSMAAAVLCCAGRSSSWVWRSWTRATTRTTRTSLTRPTMRLALL